MKIGIGRLHLARGLATNLDKSQPHPSRNSYRASLVEKWRLTKLFAFSSSAFLPGKVPLTAITTATVMEAKNAVVVHACIRVITAITTASVVAGSKVCCSNRCKYSCSSSYYCYDDSDCYGSKVCCSNRCKYSCSCSDDSDCSGSKQCCSNTCKDSCSCSYNSDCSGSRQCCSNKCKDSCGYSGLSAGVIAGAVIGTIVFFGGVIFVLSYFCCVCCPCYRHRSRGNVVQVMPQPGGRQQLMVSTSAQQMQPYPQPGNYNQPPPSYSQAPPRHPGYLQPSAQYPAAQAQGQTRPPVSAGQPVKH